MIAITALIELARFQIDTQYNFTALLNATVDVHLALLPHQAELNAQVTWAGFITTIAYRLL
jgi:NADH:ubiquinone oxidoreductase subunit 3 (subunit A)